MASTSRRSLRERVLAMFGGKRPTRHTCSSCNDLQQEQGMDETGYAVSVTSPNSNIKSVTLPSTSQPMRHTPLGTGQIKLTDRPNPQKSSSLGSFHHCTLSANMRPFGRFTGTLVAQSELDRSPQMQKPATESKNSRVRYKTKKMGVNISVPNVSTEENCSLMDTLCSEENRSSQMFGSSAAILDGSTESTTPPTSGQSSQGPVENGGYLAFGVPHEGPARKTCGDRRSVGTETDAGCGKEEDPDTELRDLKLSHGAKAIIQTADAVIKIFDGSLSIQGRFKEVVVQVNEKNVPRSTTVVDAATSTDTDHANIQHDASLPQPAVSHVQNNIRVDVGVGTSLANSCVTSDVLTGCTEDTPSGLQSKSRDLKYRLLNSDDNDESGVERQAGGLVVAKHCVNVSQLTDGNNALSGAHSSAPAVAVASSTAEASGLVAAKHRVNMSQLTNGNNALSGAHSSAHAVTVASNTAEASGLVVAKHCVNVRRLTAGNELTGAHSSTHAVASSTAEPSGLVVATHCVNVRRLTDGNELTGVHSSAHAVAVASSTAEASELVVAKHCVHVSRLTNGHNELSVAKHCVNVSRLTDRNNELSCAHLSVPDVAVASHAADVSAIGEVMGRPLAVRSEDIGSVCNNGLGTVSDKGVASVPSTTCIRNEHSLQEMQKYEGGRVNQFVDVGIRSSHVLSKTVSDLKTCLPSVEAPDVVPTCGMSGHLDVVDVDPRSDSKRNLLEIINGQKNEDGKKDNACIIRHVYSEHDKPTGTTNCEVTSQLVWQHEKHPAVTGESSQQSQESVAARGMAGPEVEGHSEDLDLDDGQISAAADSSTIVDVCSQDSRHLPDSGTAGKHGSADAVAADAKTVLHQDSSSSSGGSLVDECGLVDVYKLTQQASHQTHKLNKLIDKYRSRVLKIERLQRYLDQLNKEKEEMCRLLQGVNQETAALRLEAAELRCTVTAVCDSSVTTIGKETEARRLEPTCYRRYANIRTAADASNALAAVRCRIKALNELEVLIYRKQLMLNHMIPSLHQDSGQPAKPALLSSKTLKSKRSEQTSYSRGSRNNVVIEVLSEPNSWSELQTYTDSPVTLSTALTTSNDVTASVGQLLGTDV